MRLRFQRRSDIIHTCCASFDCFSCRRVNSSCAKTS
uniref:Uncharacterized protein n=1 Tax=Rhizophora mucronata TaxID=61149 RepID=A0A2P2P4N1_RHIMU